MFRGCSGCILCQKRLRLSWKVDERKPLELGRGTSTADGYAIAHAVLKGVAKVGSSQLSRVPQMAVANCRVQDGRIAMLYHRMANLTVYLLKGANLRSVDRHLRYPGKLRRSPDAAFPPFMSLAK
jgi:hypothetical protein